MTDEAFEKLQRGKDIIGSILTGDLANAKEGDAIVNALKAIDYAIKVAKVGGTNNVQAGDNKRTI